jgi:hypothetical protein
MEESPQENPGAGEELEQGYSIAPSQPVKKHVSPNVEKMYARISDSLEDEKTELERPFQYTIADLLILTTVTAVSLSIVMTLKKFFSMQVVVGVSGLAAFSSLIVAIYWPPERPLLRIGCWMLCGFYLLTCIVMVVCN